MNIRYIRSFLILTFYNTFSSRIFPSKTKYEFLPQWRFSSLFSFILLVEGIFSFFRKWRLRIENENGKRHRPSLGEWKRGGVRAGVREHCLTRANKYEKPFNGLRTGPNTFLPPHTQMYYTRFERVQTPSRTCPEHRNTQCLGTYYQPQAHY